MSLRVKLPFSDRLRVRQPKTSSSDPSPGGGASNSSKAIGLQQTSNSTKTRGLQTCTSCGFSSRHRVLFDRHAKRCQNGLRPPQVVARNYKCKLCKFSTTGSKEYLQHLKEKHREDFSIFLCDLCEYASRQKCKVLRHRKIIHRTAKPVDPETLQDEDSTMEQEGVVALNGVEGGKIEDNRISIDGIHEMEQGSDDDIQEVNGEEGEDRALSGTESDPQSIRSSVTSIASPIKSTDNAMHYIQRLANSPESKQPAYQCALCTYSNVQKWKVANHVRAYHMKKNVFKCPLCPYVTSRKIEFCIHKTKHAETKKVWECQECEYKTESQTNFDKHLEKHTASLPYKCALCSYSSTAEVEVQEHIKECHPSDELAVNNASVPEDVPMLEPLAPHAMQPQVYVPMAEETGQDISCRVCGLKVKNESKLRIHMVSHSTESVHWCPLCTLKYKRSSDLNRHMKRKHGKRLRDFFFMGQQEQPLNLTVTKEQMEAAAAAANYQAPIVIDEVQQATTSTDEQPLDLSVPKSAGNNLPIENLKCSHCSYQAKWPSDLRRHLLVHSVEKRFKCPCCHRKYKYQFDLNMHLRRMHRMPAGRTKVFTSASTGPPVVNIANLDSTSVTLPEGMNAPQPDDDVIFEEAPNSESPKQFLKVDRYRLTRQQVSPQGKYKCDYCPYLGKYQSEVDRHMRLHTGEKPYSCVYCVYRSHWRGDMKRHLQKHHSGEDAVMDDITNLMEQTYQPNAPPENPEERGAEEGDMEDGDGKSDMMDVDRDEDDEGPSELVIDVNPKMPPGDPGSDQDGMEFMTLTPTSSTSGSAAMSPNKANGDKRQNMCPYCPFTCEAPSKLKCHMEIHENLKRFKCAHCGKRSNWTWDVRKHIKKEHPNKELNVIELKEEEARETLPDYLHSNYKVLPKREMPEKNELPTQVPLQRFTDQLPPIDTMGVLAPLHPSNLSDGSYMEDDDRVSEYSEPRMVVQTPVRHPSIATKRCRPFKCSKCGRRSNWKWDMNKHIRNVHPQAKLIILTPEEARATMPKGGFKNTNTGRKENTNTHVKMNIVVKPETPSPPKQKHNHQFDSNRTKKFKCSACPYRSDYRSDIGRHLKRLHSPGSAIIQMLSDEEARSTLQEYKDRWVRGKFVFSPAKEKLYQEVDQQNNIARKTLSNMFDLQPVQKAAEVQPPQVVAKQLESVKTESTVLVPPCTEKTKKWKCPKCSYQDPNKKMVMRHMRQHPKVKVFQCRMCGEASDYRNSMYRHVRNRHNSTDYSGVVHESIAYVTTVVKSELESDLDVDEDTPVTYRCKICAQTSSWKSGIMRHVAETHNKDKVNSFVEVIQVSNILPALPQQVTNSGEVYFMSPDDAKQLRCDVCPYRTNKSGLLKIHKTYHRPQPGNKFKCKYCPYYVSAMRLLHQHVRLHLQELPVENNNNNNEFNIKNELDEEEEMEMDLSSNAASNDDPANAMKTSPGMSPGSAQSSPGRRYYCDQCPAVSRNKNDFLYHKQFHRPKPSAPFKCKLCNYWVSQRRLLRQHERVHLSEYIEHYHNNSLNSPKPEVLKTYADKGGSIPQMVLASPAKSDISDYEDAVQVANMKQQLIASKITSVTVAPTKFSEGTVQSSPLTMPGYMVDENGQYLNSGTFQHLNKCSHCPFTSLRAGLLHRHEQMHGPKPNEDYLRCPYCTFNVPNKKILHKHINVHSTSYQPGLDNINDVDVEGEGKQQEIKEESTEGGEKKEETDTASAQAVKPPSSPAPSEVRGIKRSADGALLNMSCLPKNSEFYIKYDSSTGSHQLERGSFKKWCCEKCPYATMKRAQFERHITLHASGQKYVCEFCDYSVPAYHLLLQHKKLHMHPNPNLLAAQSIPSLTRLPEIPADVAAAANFPATTTDPASQYGTQDSTNLFENSSDFSEPKKLYRCDRCPYTNVRRDHLLSHLRFHMVRSDFKCPYCDYSVSKQHLLVQHIKVHFNAPGCEGFTTTNSALNLSASRPASAPAASTEAPKPGEEKQNDEPVKNDVDETTSQPEYIDLAELSKAGLLKPVRCKDPLPEAKSGEAGTAEKKNGEKDDEKKDGAEEEKDDTEKKETKKDGKLNCQYCDRPFKTSEELLKHETQHLVGNQF